MRKRKIVKIKNKNKKHIIIVGCSRCGKTTLSLKLAKLGFVHYKMDSIKRGIDRNFWDSYQGEWRMVSPHMAELISRMIRENKTDIVYNKEYYVIDTLYLYPSDLAKQDLKDTIIVFLGHANTTPEEKLKQIRKYDKNVWSNKLDDEEMKYGIQRGIDYSIEVKEECEKYGIKYFDVSKNFKKVQKDVYNYILSELGV